MRVIRKGIAKLGIFTMIAATTVCLVLVGIFARLGETMPNIMLSPFLPFYVGEMPAVTEAQCAAEEEEFDSAKEFRNFVEALSKKTPVVFAPPKEVGALRVATLKTLMKRLQ